MWSDKKNYLIYYRMVKFYVRQGMVVERIHKITPFKQTKSSEKSKKFHTQKRNKANKEFEKHFYKLLKNTFYGKTIEIVRNRFRLELFKKDDNKKN